MAEVKKNSKKEELKEIKKEKKEVSKKKNDSKKAEKKSLWVRFRIFCHGVKSETLSVHWPSKKDMIRYSIATIFFIVFCAVFFYAIDVIFALIQSIFR